MSESDEVAKTIIWRKGVTSPVTMRQAEEMANEYLSGHGYAIRSMVAESIYWITQDYK